MCSGHDDRGHISPSPSLSLPSSKWASLEGVPRLLMAFLPSDLPPDQHSGQTGQWTDRTGFPVGPGRGVCPFWINSEPSLWLPEGACSLGFLPPHLPASSPVCLWVTPGAQPDAVTSPRGPSAFSFSAFVSDDADPMGRGEWWGEGELPAMGGGLWMFHLRLGIPWRVTASRPVDDTQPHAWGRLRPSMGVPGGQHSTSSWRHVGARGTRAGRGVHGPPAFWRGLQEASSHQTRGGRRGCC